MSYSKKFAGTIFCKDPFIIYTPFSPNLAWWGFQEVKEQLSGHKVYFLMNNMWSVEDITGLNRVRDWLKLHSNSEDHKFIFLCHSVVEVENLSSHGIESYLIHQNYFVDPSQFTCLNLPKKYSAIYNAAISSYKRIELASAIHGDVALITRAVDTEYFTSQISPIASFVYINFNLSGEVTWLNKQQLNSLYSQSACGLCLSEVEGAMWSAIEYLLCGIPIVSTPSAGGRDFFFTSLNSKVVEPEVTQIADAVKIWNGFVAQPGLAESIRYQAIQRQLIGIHTLKVLLAMILHSNGKYKNIDSLYENSFTDSLLRHGLAENFLDAELLRLADY